MRDTGFAAENTSAHHLRSAALWYAIWIIWTPLFIPVAVGFVQSHPSPARLALSFAGAALFFALYFGTNWRSAQQYASATPFVPPAGAKLWAPIAAMTALAAILTLANGQAWGALFIYTSACAGGRLPTREASAVIAGLTAFTLFGLTAQAGFATAVGSAVFVAIPGFTVVAVARSVTTIQRLRAEREEMAREAAVAEERLRIARDLHDLLGHSLSLIALKSELARRLVAAAPDRAAAEIGDVESVARTALQEVREAVAGYRQPTLAGELAGAREILAAAGIACRCDAPEDAARGLPSACDAALAWAVREGVTNVIRHSGAHSCRIHLTRDASAAAVEIVDDGRDTAAARDTALPAAAGGNGLRGLKERVEALGGQYTASPRAEGGFRLSVRVPLRRGEADVRTPGAGFDAIPAATTGERPAGAADAGN